MVSVIVHFALSLPLISPPMITIHIFRVRSGRSLADGNERCHHIKVAARKFNLNLTEIVLDIVVIDLCGFRAQKATF